MSVGNFTIPGTHGSPVTFTVSGALSKAVAQALSDAVNELQGKGQLFVAAAKSVQTNDIEITKTNTAKAPGVARITITFGRDAGVPNGTRLPVEATIPRGATPAMAATAIAAAINAAITTYNMAQMAKKPPGPTITKMATANGASIDLPDGKTGGIMTHPSLPANGGGVRFGPVDLSRTQGEKLGALPPVPGGQVGEAIVKDTTAGSTALLDQSANSAYKYVLNESSANIVFDASHSSFFDVFVDISIGSGSTTFYGGAGGGADVAENGNNLFLGPTSGGGQYWIEVGNGSNTIWAGSGDDVISTGTGGNLVGLGSGNATLYSGGSDTIVAGSGNAVVAGAPSDADVVFGSSGSLVFSGPSAATVVAGSGNETILAGTSDLVFGSTGSLQFVGGGAGSASTVVGGSGNETLFGGSAGATGLFFVGKGSFLLDAQSASDTVVAGAGSSSVTLFAESGGAVTLFSPISGNQLVAGSGNETLNAGGTSGGNVFWAGTGADSLVGGSGADIFAFVNGGAGGSDTISGWTAKDRLSLLDYKASGGFTETTVHGNAVVTLGDGTKITIEGIAHIPSSHIFLS